MTAGLAVAALTLMFAAPDKSPEPTPQQSCQFECAKKTTLCVRSCVVTEEDRQGAPAKFDGKCTRKCLDESQVCNKKC
jgi:hypothetical protein